MTNGAEDGDAAFGLRSLLFRAGCSFPDVVRQRVTGKSECHRLRGEAVSYLMAWASG